MMMSSQRVVLDTNVLISAVLFRGQLSILSQMIDEGEVVPCFSDETFEEFIIVASRPKFQKIFSVTGIILDEVVRKLRTRSLFFSSIKIPPVVLDDPTDDKFLACALASSTEYLVSGDQHLLSVCKYGKIKIVTPKQFLIIHKKPT